MQSAESFSSILNMRNIFLEPCHPLVHHISPLLGVAFYLESRSGGHANSIGSADIGLGGSTLTEKCSHAGDPTRSLDGHATDIVAAQLLLTIKRTDAPELRGKLIGAYRRYLGCPTDSGNSEEVVRP